MFPSHWELYHQVQKYFYLKKKTQIILPLYTTTLDLKSHKIDVNLQACSSNGLTKV